MLDMALISKTCVCLEGWKGVYCLQGLFTEAIALCALNLIWLQVHILAIKVRVSASGRMVRVSYMQVS